MVFCFVLLHLGVSRNFRGKLVLPHFWDKTTPCSISERYLSKLVELFFPLSPSHPSLLLWGMFNFMYVVSLMLLSDIPTPWRHFPTEIYEKQWLTFIYWLCTNKHLTLMALYIITLILITIAWVYVIIIPIFTEKEI